MVIGILFSAVIYGIIGVFSGIICSENKRKASANYCVAIGFIWPVALTVVVIKGFRELYEEWADGE